MHASIIRRELAVYIGRIRVSILVKLRRDFRGF